MVDSPENVRRLRVLVAIASYGQKNLAFLKQIIQIYQTMAMKVDMVVVSESPKDLGPQVKVAVGLPSSNPWSLPFAHKTVFAENAERYDLFVYTEDDIEVNEQQILAFLRATKAMEPDEIPGYLRYETAPDGTKLLTDVHRSFHWKPESVKRRGDYTIAEFTNEHAGFYILTQSQLKVSLASGGFLREPYEGRYGLPETAATDPYSCCGFRKVVCISCLDDFLIRHMSNVYVNRLHVSLASFKEQVRTLMEIRDGRHPISTLCPVEPKVLLQNYHKSYYEQPGEDVLRLVQTEAMTILVIGCGWHAAGDLLRRRGAQVTALPLDSVVGAALARGGIEVIYGSLDECLRNLAGRRFDCVFMTDLLHLQPKPSQTIGQCAGLVRIGGTLVVSGPNFNYAPMLIKRVLGRGDYRKLRTFDESGISVCGPRTLARDLRAAGLQVSAVQWINRRFGRNGANKPGNALGVLAAKDWIMQARRQTSY